MSDEVENGIVPGSEEPEPVEEPEPAEGESVQEDTSVYFEGREDMPIRPPRRRAGVLTRVLLAVLVAAAGFLVGVRVQKAWGTSTGAAAGGSRPNMSGMFRGATPTPGATGMADMFGGASAPTMGEVKLVDGTTIYVTDSQGNIIKVTTGPGTTFTKTSSASASDVRPGDTVVVQGQEQEDGTVAATRVSDSGASQSGGG